MLSARLKSFDGEQLIIADAKLDSLPSASN
jgi:hypothetical protein